MYADVSERSVCSIFIGKQVNNYQFVVCFLLGNSPASEFCMPTVGNFLSVPSLYLPMKMEQTECFETSVYKIQTPGNYPEKTYDIDVYWI